MLRSGWSALRIIASNARGTVLLYLLMMAAMAALASMRVWMMERLIGTVAGADGVLLSSILVWVFLLLASILFQHAGSCMSTLADISISRHLYNRFLPKVIGKYRRLEYSCLEDDAVLDSIKRMGERPQEGIKDCFFHTITAARSFITLGGLAVYFFSLSWIYGVIFVGIVGANILFDIRTAYLRDAALEEQSANERASAYLEGLFADKRAVYELKLFGAVPYILQKWKGLAEITFREKLRVMLRTERYTIVSSALQTAFAVASILAVSSDVLAGRASVALLIALITAIGQIYLLAGEFSYSVQDMGESALATRYFERFMRLPERREGGAPLPADCTIEFDNVRFTYPGTQSEILKGVSFALRPGEKLAIVGENGAGKSTIIKLMLGLYAPTSGEIRVGGTPLSSLSGPARRELLSVAFQDSMQYDMTLRENIAISDVERMADNIGIQDALGDIGAEDLRAIGLEQPLGRLHEHGMDLSGGQWQKIAIARALFRHSRYILLDEPTAALDPLAESRLYEDFLKIAKGERGTVIISHRMASARLCDRILLVRDGLIAEDGSHERLMERDGLYAQMYHAQSAWYIQEGGDRISDSPLSEESEAGPRTPAQ